MAKIDTKSNKENLYEYPPSEQISIDKSNLNLQLIKFKEAITESISIDSVINFLITSSALWIPMFTSEFRNLFGYSSSVVKGGYTVFIVVMTFYLFYRLIFKGFIYYFNSNKVSSNPEKMSQIILDKCNKK